MSTILKDPLRRKYVEFEWGISPEPFYSFLVVIYTWKKSKVVLKPFTTLKSSFTLSDKSVWERRNNCWGCNSLGGKYKRKKLKNRKANIVKLRFHNSFNNSLRNLTQSVPPIRTKPFAVIFLIITVWKHFSSCLK